MIGGVQESLSGGPAHCRFDKDACDLDRQAPKKSNNKHSDTNGFKRLRDSGTTAGTAVDITAVLSGNCRHPVSTKTLRLAHLWRRIGDLQPPPDQSTSLPSDQAL